MMQAIRQNRLMPSTWIKVVVICLCLFGINACVTSEKPQETIYYVLDLNPPKYEEQKSSPQINGKQYSVLPVTLPDYLNQANLVLKLSDHQIKIANYHIWAEDLKQSVQNVLITELNRASKQDVFVSNCSRCSQISVDITHFYPTESGDVFLSGNFLINQDYQNQQHHSFTFTKSLSNGGYDEAVAAMRALLDELAVDINNRLATLANKTQ